MKYSAKYKLYLSQMTDPPNQMANTANFEKLDGLLSDGLYPIGEIRITRNPGAMSPNWLLCNGEMINTGQYPLIEPLLQDRKSGFDYNWTEVPGITPQAIVSGVVAGTKWWVALDYNNQSQGTTVKYKSGSLLSGSWATKTVATNINYRAYGIKFLNGYFVAIGGGFIGSTNRIIWSVLGAPTGTWVETHMDSNAEGSGVVDIAFGNGFWCVSSGDYYGNYIQSDSPQGVWPRGHVVGRNIAFANDFWVGSGRGLSNNTIEYKQGAPNAPWSMISAAPGTSSDGIYKTVPGNGYWMTDSGFYVQGNPNSLPEGTWPKNSNWPAANYLFSYTKDRWLGKSSADNKINYIIGSPNGTVKTRTFSGIDRVLYLSHENDVWIMIADYSPYRLFFAIDGYRLPDIPIPDAYAYIKAAELAA